MATEFDDLTKTLDKAIKNFEKASNEALDELGARALRKVKLKSPVDSGALRESWQVTKIDSTTRKISAEGIDYAIPVENGHRTKNGKFVNGAYMLTKTIEELSDKDVEKVFDMFIGSLFK